MQAVQKNRAVHRRNTLCTPYRTQKKPKCTFSFTIMQWFLTRVHQQTYRRSAEIYNLILGSLWISCWTMWGFQVKKFENHCYNSLENNCIFRRTDSYSKQSLVKKVIMILILVHSLHSCLLSITDMSLPITIMSYYYDQWCNGATFIFDS